MLKRNFVVFTLIATAACNSDESGADDASTKDQSVNDVVANDVTKNDSSVDAAFDAGTDAADAALDASDASDATLDASDGAVDANDASDASLDAVADVTEGGTSEGGVVDGGGSAAACNACAQTNCSTPIAVCAQDTTCLAWLQCVNLCTTTACEATCDAQYAGASSVFDPVYTCACTNCKTECANNLAPCTHGQDGGA